ncbi:MAG: hypothetical protein HKM06_07805 [Spirochaetales bacterium]|nr:hypothetical protein [Spirochaetales bacterium]
MTLQGLQPGHGVSLPPQAGTPRSEEASETASQKAQEAAKAASSATNGLRAWQGTRINASA